MGGRRGEVVEPTPTPAVAAEDCGLEFSEAAMEEAPTDPVSNKGDWGLEKSEFRQEAKQLGEEQRNLDSVGQIVQHMFIQ